MTPASRQRKDLRARQAEAACEIARLLYLVGLDSKAPALAPWIKRYRACTLELAKVSESGWGAQKREVLELLGEHPQTVPGIVEYLFCDGEPPGIRAQIRTLLRRLEKAGLAHAPTTDLHGRPLWRLVAES